MRTLLRTLVALSAFVTLQSAGAQSTPGVQRGKDRKDNITPKELMRLATDTSNMTQRSINLRGLKPALQVAQVLADAKEAEIAGKRDVMAHHLAWAVIATRNYNQRDSLLAQLEVLVHAGAWGPIKPTQVNMVIDRVLDSLFQTIYDRDIPVARAPASASERIVLGEYLTGVQCGICWSHDRYFAALLQRYSTNQLVVIGYHDGPGYPIARTLDSLNKYIGGITDGTNTNNVADVLYNDRLSQSQDKLGDWIDGAPRIKVYDLASTITQKYQTLAAVIDARLQEPPGASIAMTLTSTTTNDKTLSAIDVVVNVTPTVQRARLGVRLVLVQDTARVTGYTPRRLHYMAARTIAWFGPKQMFYTLPTNSTEMTTIRYTFDVASLQRDILQPFEVKGPNEDVREGFAARRDWLLATDRLAVVAIVQDQDTKEVLQTAYQALRANAK